LFELPQPVFGVPELDVIRSIEHLHTELERVALRGSGNP
jgi:hypothetical protein